MELAKIRMPNLNAPGLNADAKLEMVVEYMLTLEKQMRYVLNNLEEDNLGTSLGKTISAAEALTGAGYGEQLTQKLSKGDLVNNLGVTTAGKALDAVQGMLLDRNKLNIADFPKQVLSCVYPVGSIYISVSSASPEILFGGTWVQLKDVFLLAAGDVYNVGETGGEEEHTLTVEEIPAHSHTGILYRGNQKAVSLNPGTGGYQLSWAADTGYGVESDLETGEAGGGTAHNNMPPYTVVNVWQRTA